MANAGLSDGTERVFHRRPRHRALHAAVEAAVSGLDREGDQARHPCIGFCIAGRLTRLHSDWAVIAAAGAFSIGVPPPRTSNPVRLKRNEHMADLLLATPALAQKVWRSMASPSTRRVARKLSQSCPFRMKP